MQDDEILFRDGPPSPQSRPTSPGPDLDIDSESDPQPRPPAPEAARRRAVAHVRPVTIADIVRDVAGPDPMRVIRDFDRVYMPEPGPEGAFVVNSAVVGKPGAGRRSDLKRKAAETPRSYSEVFAMLTSGNSSHAEAARLLKTITNVASVAKLYFCFEISMCLTSRLYLTVYASRYSTHFVTHHGQKRPTGDDARM